jgi:hypothetical protein
MEIISMSIFPRRGYVIAATCLAFFLAGPRAVDALVLDWDAVTWSNASMTNSGAVSNSYDLNGDTVNDIKVALTPQSNVWTTDPTSGTVTPAINQTMTGGLLPVQNSLNLAANLHTNSNLTVQISFTGKQPGADNVSFTLFDIDLTADRDVISNIYGLAPDGTHIAATITNIGSTVILNGTGLGQSLTSDVASPDNSSNGNATISFGSNLITDVFFTFSNSSGPPRYQDLGIGDISFTPVPEINPAAASAVSCLVAVGLTCVVHRRAKLKARRLAATRV